MPFVSVIVPNYNHASYLRQRIDSIIGQSYQDFEIIILDDCSADNSRQVIESYRGQTKISHIQYSEKNSGSAFGLWQKGIGLAKGDWIWIAESDDIAEPAFLEEAVRAILQFPLLGLFYCDCFIIDETGNLRADRFAEIKNTMFHTDKWNSSYYTNGITEVDQYLKYDCTINNMSSVVVRKSILNAEVGQLDRFRFYGDWFFFLKAGLSCNMYYLNKPLNYYRMYANSHSTSPPVAQSRQEFFIILSLLYNADKITHKDKLLDHFTYFRLAFGLIKDGPGKAWQILVFYFKTDMKLALNVVLKLIVIKLKRQKRTFFPMEKDKLTG